MASGDEQADARAGMRLERRAIIPLTTAAILLLSASWLLLPHGQQLLWLLIAGLALVILLSAWWRQRSTRELEARAFGIDDPLLVTDAQGTILCVNAAFEQEYGYRAHEVVGRRPGVLRSHRHDAAFYRDMWRQLDDTGRWCGEIWNRRKDGSLVVMWLSITALRSGDGTVVHYLGHGRNPNRLNDLDPQLERLSHYDPLTDLPNRRFARSRLEQELALAARRGTIGAVLCLDLDHFKNVNDALGHQAGDTLLVTVAERLRGTLRAEDTAARQGDDEFVILLAPEAGGVDAVAHNAYVVARKILDAMARPLHIGEHELRVGASIGIALYTGRENDAEAVLRQADGAMNRAKGSRGSIHFFSDDMQIEADRRLLVNSELRAAVAREQLRLVFQPQVDAGGAIIGAEALVRWQHPQHGLIPPGEFLPIAEDLGLAPIVDWWVLAAACRQLAGWRAQGLLPAGCVLAINVSAQLVASEDFVAGVQATLAESGAPAESLVLELTERSLLHDPDNVARKMNRLRELGLRFSVDDFGTGYSSLMYLKQLPIDSLKVDRSFVRDLPRDDHDAAIVNATLGLAFNLGLDVVAEGVETEAQLAFLIERGCRMFQGFHFSPPVDRETFEHMLTNGGCTAI